MKPREVKKRVRVDQTLGVRQEGRKEERQQGTKDVGEEICKGKVHKRIYGENKRREGEVKLAREKIGEKKREKMKR